MKDTQELISLALIHVFLQHYVLQQKYIENVSEENPNVSHKFLMGLVLVPINLCYVNVIL